MMQIKEETLQYALDVLKKQREFCGELNTRNRQYCYYKGLWNMLEIILTDAFQVPVAITLDSDGTHHVQDDDNEEIYI